MGDILSQAEIDALLSAISSGVDIATPEEEVPEEHEEPAAKIVRLYDFRRQDKFSKEHIRTLWMLHEGFARILGTAFSAQMRMLVQIEVVAVEQLTFDEYCRSLPNPTILNVFTLNPLVGNSLFEINLDTASIIIDRMLGGPGKITRIRRDLSDIERTLIGAAIDRVMASLAEAWSNILAFRPKLEGLEMNPRFVQIVPPSDIVVLITFEAKFGDHVAPLSLCIPFIVLEPVMGKISAQTMFSLTRQAQDPEYRIKLEERISNTTLDVQVLLGETEIMVSDVMDLGLGDVLALHAPVDKDLQIKVGGRMKYRGRPGLLKNKLAVQLTEVIDEMEGEEE